LFLTKAFQSQQLGKDSKDHAPLHSCADQISKKNIEEFKKIAQSNPLKNKVFFFETLMLARLCKEMWHSCPVRINHLGYALKNTIGLFSTSGTMSFNLLPETVPFIDFQYTRGTLKFIPIPLFEY
jgi:hypothetical protein